MPAHLLTTTITVRRNSPQLDSGGSPYDLWSDNLQNIPARVQQLSGGESIRGGRENNRRQWLVFTNVDDIGDDDQIFWLDQTIPGRERLRTFDIQSVRNPNNLSDHLEIDCEETDG